jgi:hypothetical protein
MRLMGGLTRGRWVAGGLWLSGLAALAVFVPARPRLVVPGVDYFAGFTPDGGQFATVLRPGPNAEPGAGAALWDTRTGQLAGHLQGPGPAYGLTFARDGRRAVAMRYGRGVRNRSTLMAWDRNADGHWSGPYVADVPSVSNHFRVFLPDSRAILTSGDGGLILWDPPGQPPQPLNPGPSRPGSTAVQWAIGAGGARQVVAWLSRSDPNWPVVAVYDTATGRELCSRKPIDRPNLTPTHGGTFSATITALQVAPDGRTVAISGQANWGLIQPNGQLDRHFVVLWDVVADRVIARLVSHRGAAFTADGRSLVSVRQSLSADELVLYDLEAQSERLVASYPRSIPWGGATPSSGFFALRRDWVTWPTRLADGRILAVRTNDPATNGIADRLAGWSERFLNLPVEARLDGRLIDASIGRELAALRCGDSPGMFSADGSTLAISTDAIFLSRAGSKTPWALELWDVPPRQPLSWLVAGFVGWTLIVWAGAGVIRRRRQRPQVVPAEL